MKKFLFLATVLMVLAGTAPTSIVHTSNATVIAGKKNTTVTSADIPPPTCPWNDPNGCGILD